RIIAPRLGNGFISRRYFTSAAKYAASKTGASMFYVFKDKAGLEKSIACKSISAASYSEFIRTDSTLLSQAGMNHGVACFPCMEFYNERDKWQFSKPSGTGAANGIRPAFIMPFGCAKFAILPAGFSYPAPGDAQGLEILTFSAAARRLLGEARGISFARKNLAIIFGPVLPPRKHMDAVFSPIATGISRSEAFFKATIRKTAEFSKAAPHEAAAFAKAIFSKISKFVADSFPESGDSDE
ncbi:MAG TPA: hypothetical protein PLO51_00040, partial [Candidatus Micrarchaeota archaeon]|nr:hypothetical protein [Candidatus Micrarchaeota archaeon]